jgi:hypothetical protein
MLKKLFGSLFGNKVAKDAPPSREDVIADPMPSKRSKISQDLDKVKAPAGKPVDKMTKNELIDFARANDIKCNRGMVKAEIVKKIKKNGLA